MGKFEDLLHRATNSANLEPNLAAILEMCDLIRQGDVQPKRVIPLVKRKLNDKHTLVSYYSLFVMEALMKNCGPDMHQEILSKDILDKMQDMITNHGNYGDKSKDKCLELIQTWNVAFRHSSYRLLTDIHNQLAMAGYKFPEIATTDLVFITDKPPEWKPDNESKSCHMCSSDFSITVRKHHCRNCGECFCAKCCSQVTTLPKFGIEKEVRVCDSCYLSSSNKPTGDGISNATGTEFSELPKEYLQSSLFHESQAPTPQDPKRESELKEQEELDLAIAMSLTDKDNKSAATTNANSTTHYHNVPHLSSVSHTPEPSAPFHSPSSSISSYPHILANRPLPYPPNESSHRDYPELSYDHDQLDDSHNVENALAKYLDRGYWDDRREKQSSAEAPSNSLRRTDSPVYAQINFNDKQQKSQLSKISHASEVSRGQRQRNNIDNDIVIGESLKKNLDLFVSLLRDVNEHGRSVATDPTIQSLYSTLNAMHPEFLRVMDEIEKKREFHQELEQKASTVKEARASLNKSRREYLDKVKLQEEQQRLLATMLLEQNLALIKKQQEEQARVSTQLAVQREQMLADQQQQKELHKQIIREQIAMQQRQQEQQVIEQHLSQPIPSRFDSPYAAAVLQATAPNQHISLQTGQLLNQHLQQLQAQQQPLTVDITGPSGLVQPPQQPPISIVPSYQLAQQIPGLTSLPPHINLTQPQFLPPINANSILPQHMQKAPIIQQQFQEIPRQYAPVQVVYNQHSLSPAPPSEDALINFD